MAGAGGGGGGGRGLRDEAQIDGPRKNTSGSTQVRTAPFRQSNEGQQCVWSQHPPPTARATRFGAGRERPSARLSSDHGRGRHDGGGPRAAPVSGMGPDARAGKPPPPSRSMGIAPPPGDRKRALSGPTHHRRV
eukprot:gene10250-23261_t